MDGTAEQEVELLIGNKDLSGEARDTLFSDTIKGVGNDSLKNALIFKVAYHYLTTKDSLLFRKWHRKGHNLSFQLRDKNRIAESYWDLGDFYAAHEVLDSSFHSYSRAYRFYLKSQNKNRAAQMLTNLAITQNDMNDFTGSEITSIEALKLLNKSGKPRNLYIIYNSLGIAYNNLREYDKAIESHKKALEYIQQDDILAANSLNNIGVVYEYQKKHDEALKHFEEAFALDSIFFKDPRLYAMLLDNITYNKFLKGDGIPDLTGMYRAMEIRDSIGHFSGKIVNQVHLSRIFAQQKDTVRAIEFLKEAYHLAEIKELAGEQLTTLRLLSSMDKKNSKTYLEKYIPLQDSLQLLERTTRNKFNRIKFQTDEYIERNKILSAQRTVLLSVGIGIVALGISGFLYKKQSAKNREMVLEHKQRKADEKILKLLLEQQEIKEKEGGKERRRLSAELHDGILGRLFGLRLSLESLNENKDKCSVAQRKKYINDLSTLGKDIELLCDDLDMGSAFIEESEFVMILQDIVDQHKKSRIQFHMNWRFVSSYGDQSIQRSKFTFSELFRRL